MASRAEQWHLRPASSRPCVTGRNDPSKGGDAAQFLARRFLSDPSPCRSPDPTSHPEFDSKSGKTCPVTGESHDYWPPAMGDSRSVCPALKTTAKCVRRDGKNLSMLVVFRGLKGCHGLSSLLAAVLVMGGWLLIRPMIGRISLFEIGLHHCVEHDVSVARHLAKYAPIAINLAAHVVVAAEQVP
ncbi:hypothetical protein C8R47DRAFT_1268164 [Mycena vitilis]|nr:hypothetical protein C8R47DRAFT_1268164 [Mycena vitilis]